MKVTNIFLALLFISFGQLFAQAFHKDTKVANLGIGAGAYSIQEGFLSYYPKHNSVGASLTTDIGITNQVSAGVQWGYSQYHNKDGFGKARFLHGALRGSYHLAEMFQLMPDKLDLYAGLGLGYRYVALSEIEDFNDPDLTKAERRELRREYKREFKKETGMKTLFISLHAGARYFFKKNMAVFGELGTGFSVGQFGVSVKF